MTAVGIVAGGTGSRMGATDLPKQFLPLCGLPVIVHTARAFLSNDAIDNVIICFLFILRKSKPMNCFRICNYKFHDIPPLFYLIIQF